MIIAIANQKGGVGKTTTAVNLSAALTELGFKTLLVDTDPQGNATSGMGIQKRSVKASSYEVLLGDVAASEAIITASDGRTSIQIGRASCRERV
jgi:chromosome partitioning protein